MAADLPRRSIDDAVTNKVLVEERWAYERRIERMTFRAMSDYSERPVEEGGLGYRLSAATLVRRCNDYLIVSLGHETETREAHRARELEALDKQERALYTFLDPVDRVATAKIATALGMELATLMERKPHLIAYREDKVRIAAIAQLRLTGVERRKLLGLDEPVKAEVTVNTATDKALADLAAQLGQPTPERQHHGSIPDDDV